MLCGGLALACFPGAASAQFVRGASIGPSPLYIYPNGNGGYSAQLNVGISGSSPYGLMNFGYAYPYTMNSYYGPEPTAGSGYFTGGSSGYSYSSGLQQDINAAQQAAAKMLRKNQDEAKELIDAQWAYERLGVTGQNAVKGAKIQAEELQKALAVKDESEVASGDALNRILVAIVTAEGKGAKGVSAFLPPQLLDEIRFSGGPAADLLNMAHQSGKLPFPPGFPGPTLEPLQTALQADFTAAVAPLTVGKPADPLKVARLESTVKKLNTAAPPVIRNLSFDDASSARHFLNQLNGAIVALKSASMAGLLNPKWATDGTSVADLVKFMTRYKLLFAPATPGAEGSYFSLHKALATYLFVLTQAKK